MTKTGGTTGAAGAMGKGRPRLGAIEPSALFHLARKLPRRDSSP